MELIAIIVIHLQLYKCRSIQILTLISHFLYIKYFLYFVLLLFSCIVIMFLYSYHVLVLLLCFCIHIVFLMSIENDYKYYIFAFSSSEFNIMIRTSTFRELLISVYILLALVYLTIWEVTYQKLIHQVVRISVTISLHFLIFSLVMSIHLKNKYFKSN